MKAKIPSHSAVQRFDTAACNMLCAVGGRRQRWLAVTSRGSVRGCVYFSGYRIHTVQ